MKQFYEGKVTIDGNLYLVKEDGELYNHLQLDMYAPLSDCIHRDDLCHMTDLMDAVQKDETNNAAAIRMLCRDGSYRWFMVRAEKEQFEVKGQPVFNLIVTDWLCQIDYMDFLKEQNSYNSSYLQMLEGILLFYDRDVDELEIFMEQSNRKVSIFNGKVSQWLQQSLNGKIPKRDAKAFCEFCEDLEAGRSGKYDILTSMFSKQGKQSLYTFQCRNIHGQSQIVLGCIVPIGQVGVNMYRENYEKDVGIDILNKKAITEYARKALHAAGENKIYIGILDLDDFKAVNDRFGHLFGDEVLRVCSEIVKDALENRGIVGRIGGDEMMFVVDQITEYNELRNLLRTIRTNIEWAYKGKREDITTTCSIGIAAYPDQGENFEEVFAVADKMLYIAKFKGKNRYVIFTPGLHDKDNSLSLQQSLPQNEDIQKLKEDKLGVLQRMVDDYLLQKIITNENMFREIGYAFDLQEILYVSEEMAYALQWTEEGTCYDTRKIQLFHLTEEMFSHFDKYHMFVMNNYSTIEGKMPELAVKLRERNVQNAIFYRISDTNGFIMFARKNARHLWAEYEVMSFSIIGKTLEKAILNR